jgi:glycosyltransferase involved in cell wall biosynthesis
MKSETASMFVPARPRIFYYEGNPDGTVGGSYFSLLYLVEGVDRRRFEPVVGFRRDIPFVQRFRDAGVDVHIVPGHRAARLAGGRGRRLLRPIQSAVNLTRFFLISVPAWALFLRHQRIDLVHANNSVTRCHDLMLGALLAGVPTVTHERGINTQFAALSRFLAPRLAAILCISEAVRANLTSHRVGGDNLHVIYNGLDAARIVPRRETSAVRRAFDVGPDSPVLVMIGNIKRWKGQDVVVRALREVVTRQPHAVCLFVGQAAEADRPFQQELDALVRELSLSSHVRFIGYQEQIADVLNVADVAIHASSAPEPFGRVLLEAMALGKPVVGARAGAVPEIVDEGVTGLTFEPGNWRELSQAILALLADRSRAARMGSAGRARLVNHFGIGVNVARTEAVYDAVIRRRRGERTVPRSAEGMS